MTEVSTAMCSKVVNSVTQSEQVFPTLKLPMLVLRKILKTIDIETVILISLCSRKMYHLVKNFQDKSVKLRIKIYGEDSRVEVVTPKDYCHQVKVLEGKSRNLERVNINGHLVPIDRSRKQCGWKTYWNDRVKGLQSIMEYLSDLFGIKKVTSILVTPDTMRLLDVLKERQGNDYELGTHTHLSEEESHFILENYPAKVLRISGLSSNFPIGKYLQTVDSLYVGSKVLITLDDLLNMNCVELVLVSNHFTGTEIKRILQHWAIGGLRRLKYLSLWVSDLNMEDVLGELTHTRMTEKREYKCNIGRSVSFSDRLITRNDGVVASFQYDQEYSIVKFGVWPDSEGNKY
ncbi:hypothetical protein CRE_27813 [Caenorhabditis remanei]|uniref:F-box domain-containing protein n=1 Tax=Caenorhabditis remanei TaxID=31234 RepID=E3N5H4_CAERE|nr:hypothetical protein CRE_27813 [Caenorhabditis remanei]